MRTAIVPLALAVLALAGCKKSDQPKSAEEVKAAVAQIAKPQPGKYRTTMKIAKIEFPGMPPEMAERMKTMFSQTGKSHEFCLTKADADKGFEEFNKRTAQGACKYDRFSMSGGKLDAKMSCQTGKGMTATYEMAGEFSSTGSHVTMKGDQTAPGMPGGGMHMEAEVTSERVGDCG